MKKMFTALGLLFSLNTLSQTIYFVNDNASGAGNGTSWTDAFTELQDALTAAESGDQIWVAAGTYYPDEGVGLTNDDFSHSFHLENGVAIYGGFAGTETQLSERNVTANVTMLSGEIQQDNDIFNNAFHVVQSSSVDNTAVLDGFTITGGNAGAANYGGGMHNNESSPTLTNCSFTENAAHGGGGMYNLFSSPNLTNCSFSANTASGLGGGMLNNESSPTLTNCSFTENTATDGGGIANVSDIVISSPTFTNCSFSGNRAGAGGGIYSLNIFSQTLTNCSFTENTANNGGGMFNHNSSPTLTNCSFSGNTADFSGGGMVNHNSSPALTNCILWGNTPNQIANDESSPVVTYSVVQGGFPGTGNLDQDPLFVDAANGDLHLQAGSPAIDAGLNSANTISVDLDGNPRVVNGTIDMGAFEFQGTTAPLTITSVTATPATLWPPNHKMKEVQVSVITTGGSGSTSCSITAVSSNEPQSGKGKGDPSPDWLITGADQVLLRAERDGKGNGRIYTITVTCTDAGGSSASKNVLVTVPHDQGKKAKADIVQSERSETISAEADALHIIASPNPSTNAFNLTISSGDAQQSIQLRVMNTHGKVVEQRQNIKSGQSLQIGQEYAAGMYIIEIQQGSERRTIKVVKQ